jgi:hypothetical protein
VGKAACRFAEAVTAWSRPLFDNLVGIRHDRPLPATAGKKREVVYVKRVMLLCGLTSFVMAFIGTFLALAVSAPASVAAQEGGFPVSGSIISDPDGNQRIRVGTGPGFWAALRVFAPDGTTPRAEVGTGGNPARGGVDPAAAGFNLFSLDGTLVGRLGTGGPGPELRLSDRQGNNRVALRVAEDGTPSIQMLDASGNVTWSAR